MSNVEAAAAPTAPDVTAPELPFPSSIPRQSPVAASQSEMLWLAAALVAALICSLRTMAPALGPDPVVQDDARKHVFWMQRFRDPALFPNDPIADYFESVAPPGYSLLYQSLSPLIEPLALARLLPFGLGLATALAAFGLIRRLGGSPVAALLGTTLLNWYLWQQDDLASATPRAFLPPFLLALLWALAAGRRALATGLTIVSACFYPVATALGIALLTVRLVEWRKNRPRLSLDRADWLAAGAALSIGAAIALLPGSTASRFGSVVTLEQAHAMPEFGPEGRRQFFVDDPINYWLVSPRSGLDLTATDRLLPGFPLLAELALPAMLLLVVRRLGGWPWCWRLGLLVQLLVASGGLFALAHLLLFRLYLPLRYVRWSLPIVLAVVGGLALARLIHLAATRRGAAGRSVWLEPALAAVISAGLLLYLVPNNGRFLRDRFPEVSAYLLTQSKDLLVAGPPRLTDSLPSFSARSVLTSKEYLADWHTGYYADQRAKMLALIEAYYAESPAEVLQMTRRYGVGTILVDRIAFSPPVGVRLSWNVPRGSWQPFGAAIESKFTRPRHFALIEAAARCGTLDDGTVALVPVACLDALAANLPGPAPSP